MARKTKFTTSIIKKKLRLKPRARKGQKNKKITTVLKWFIPWPYLTGWETRKLIPLSTGQTWKMTPNLRRKQNLTEFSRNTQIFLASLPQYSKERFSSWFVSRQAGHLRTWKLTDIITLPYPAKDRTAITTLARPKNNDTLSRADTLKNHIL